uniref:NADH dehydrogenase subunit 6 n=1 Tax=Dictyla platyoma TaxID=2172477 RepID=A0A343WNN3_9HEMI|nr:NADH dehydrogenase subunit 6 [Dictyla platyoma]AWD31609.1 NADH dehydrogenase subunit 6 [Dictyla platyoma]
MLINTLLTLMLMVSFTFTTMMTPLSMIFILITQTFLISLISATLTSTFWYSYMLILIMISGLLVMFMYMASIASNEKFKISAKILPLILTSTMLLSIMNKSELFLVWKKNNMEKMNINQEIFFNKLFNTKFIIPSLTLIMLLFFMMIIISFLISTNEGPMRKSN